MQTFLPYADFIQTAKCLDYKRLGKQRVEAKQILTAIEKKTGWRHHPCTKMWQNYVPALKLYFNVIVTEWINRNYINNMPLYDDIPNVPEMPWWLGMPEFHLAHQSKLVQKLPEHYLPYFPNVTANLNYLWPTAQKESP